MDSRRITRDCWTAALFFATIAFHPRLSGQVPGEPPTFRSDAQLVLTGFHVVAAKRNVTGLTASDFQLLVDGSPHAITTFEQGGSVNTPVEIVLVFDSSGSVHGAGLLDEGLFRDNLLAGLPDLTVSVYSFGGPPANSLVRFCGPTSDPLVLRRAFQSVVRKQPGEAALDLHKPGKDSLIYESIIAALKDSTRSPRPVTRLMMVVSDGLPGGELNPTTAATAALQMGIPVYPVLVGHQARIAEFNMRMASLPRQGETPGDASPHAQYFQKIFVQQEAHAALFTNLGGATGALSFDPPELNPSSAREIIAYLAGEVRTEYIVGFSPESGSTSSPHQIEVRFLGGRPGAKIAGGFREAVY